MAEAGRIRLICGVDEAGRGPLAGPVVAGAVILDPCRPIAGLADSKKLAPGRREHLAQDIRAYALAAATGLATAAEIDVLNILQASLLAMRRAVAALGTIPQEVLVDGNRTTDFGIPARAVVGGDATVPAISAASILAKTVRDRMMLEVHSRWPEYGFDRHKGYPTAAHLQALQRHGACAEHRRSFAPVRHAISQGILQWN